MNHIKEFVLDVLRVLIAFTFIGFTLIVGTVFVDTFVTNKLVDYIEILDSALTTATDMSFDYVEHYMHLLRDSITNITSAFTASQPTGHNPRKFVI